MFYVVQNSTGMRVVPHSDMMFTSPDDVWYSSELEVECHAFIQQFCDSYEPDPRDQSYVDDFGDPCS